MTREEAKIILDGPDGRAETIIKLIEALGLIKFEEPVKIHITEYCNYRIEKYGTVRLEEWPEGLVLWVGGQIRWKSWEQKSLYDTTAVMINYLSKIGYRITREDTK